jgi:hypothetical protein
MLPPNLGITKYSKTLVISLIWVPDQLTNMIVLIPCKFGKLLHIMTNKVIV